MEKKNFFYFYIFIVFANCFLSSSINAKEEISLGIIVGNDKSKEFLTSAIIKEVENGSPADKAGIIKGDLINSLNKKKIKNPIEFIKTLSSLKNNEEVEIEIIRNNKYIKKKILLLTKEISNENIEFSKKYSLGFNGISNQAKKQIRVNYFSREILDKYLFNGSNNDTLIVTCIRKGSTAEKSGIKLYDEIIEIDGNFISDLQNLNFNKKKLILIKVIRNFKRIEIKLTSELSSELEKLSFNCVNEYKEYECSKIVNIDYDKRRKNYFENLFACLEEKNISTIPFGPIQYDYEWIKVDTITNVIDKYSKKNTRDLEKLNYYLPIASEILSEINLYLEKDENDKIASVKYKDLRKKIAYANKYALLKNLKDTPTFEINDETINGYKKTITYLINKNQKISHSDRYIFNEAFNLLWENGHKNYIYENWPKAIKLIEWKNLGLAEIKTFRMFYNLGDLYASEPNYEQSIKYYKMGIKELDEWAVGQPVSSSYVVYKRRMHVRKSFQIGLFATKKYNENFDNKYIKMMETDLKESEDIISYFHSLPKKIKKEIRNNNPKHLSDVYNTMTTMNAFLQKPNKMFETAVKSLREVEKYSKGVDRNIDIFEAYHQVILGSIGGNRLNETVYYLNQSKNLATQLVKTNEGLETISNFFSFQLPTIINSGLYTEAEDILNFIDDFLYIDKTNAIGRFQSDVINYSRGRINIVNKNYKEAVVNLESASRNYLEKPGAGIYNMYSAFASLLLLEAYVENQEFDNFEKHFQLLTGSKPINYKSIKAPNDLIGTSVSKHHYISSEIDMSMLAALLKYLKIKNIKISKKDSSEFFSFLKDYFKEYVPGEESRLEMIRYSSIISSVLAPYDNIESEKFLTKMIREIEDEYTSEIYDSNLTPVHKIDDIIESYLNAAYFSNNKKFLNKSYKIIQIVSNSITAKDIKKSIKNKKFQDPSANKLIEKYQKLQIEKVSLSTGSQFDLSAVSETTFQERSSFDVTRSIEIDNKLKNLEKKIKIEIPTYFKKIKPKGASLGEIQKKLGKEQVLIEYFFFKDTFFVLIIKKKDHKLLKISQPIKDLELRADKVRQSIKINNRGGIDKFDTINGYEIYKNLFSPVEKFINLNSEIIIIPNKFLKNIPLQLLPTHEAEKCIDCSNINWLMNKYNFAYMPNAEFFAFKKTKNIIENIKIKSSKPIFFGIGNPNLKIIENIETKKVAENIDKLTSILNRGSFIKNTNEIKNIYGPVEGSQEELEKIKKYLEPSKSKLLLLDEANEDNIKNTDLRDFKIIHFATHGELAGVIKGQNEPFLVLTPPKIGTSLNDGILTMSEIMNLENNADLVILSACNTAGGNIRQSEGFSGLARAFLFSGSKSVLVSNWYVETFAAMELTTAMIKELKENPKISTSRALTKSMKKFIKNNNKKSHPFYWAPFVVVGINSNINLN